MLNALSKEKKVRTKELKDYRRTLSGIKIVRAHLVQDLIFLKKHRQDCDRTSDFNAVRECHLKQNILREELLMTEGRYKGVCAQLTFVGAQLVRLDTLIAEQVATLEN